MSIVAITGAGGMIGRHLVDVFSASTSRCRLRALLLPGEELPPSFGDVQIFRGDVRNPNDLSPLLDGAETVFHLASLVGQDANRAQIERAREVNVDGTLNLIEQAKANRVLRFVILSTCCVYGLYGSSDELIDERGAHAPFDLPYDRTKAEAEALVTSEDPVTFPWSVLQIPVALGGSHTLDKPTALSMSRLARAGIVPRPFPGTSWVNYVFGRDVADALLLLAQHPDAIGQAFIFSESAPLPNFLSWAAQEIGQKPLYVPVPRFALQLASPVTHFAQILANRRRFSSKKIENRLGFRPSVGLRSGLSETISHYQKVGLIKMQETA